MLDAHYSITRQNEHKHKPQPLFTQTLPLPITHPRLIEQNMLSRHLPILTPHTPTI